MLQKYHNMAFRAKDMKAPLIRPKPNPKAMKAPAAACSGPEGTSEGPYIIARDAKYPLVKENTVMKAMGKASLSNQMGAVLSPG